MLARIRKAARELLTLDEKNPRRVFEGQALINKMLRIGVLDKSQTKLDYVLGLTTKQFLDRRLQTIVFNSNMAKSKHHARVLIYQKKVSITRTNRKQVVNIPSYVVRRANDSYISLDREETQTSRTKRRTERKRAEKAEEDA